MIRFYTACGRSSWKTYSASLSVARFRGEPQQPRCFGVILFDTASGLIHDGEVALCRRMAAVRGHLIETRSFLIVAFNAAAVSI